MKKKLLICSIALIIIASFIVVYNLFNVKYYGYNGKQYRVGDLFMSNDGCNTCSFDKKGQMMCTLMACAIDDQDNLNESVDVNFEYINDKLHYVGKVKKPTPCHILETETVIRESYPEQVDLKFSVKDSGEICIQVIDEEEVSGDIDVSKDAQINIYLNDVLVKK